MNFKIENYIILIVGLAFTALPSYADDNNAPQNNQQNINQDSNVEANNNIAYFLNQKYQDSQLDNKKNNSIEKQVAESNKLDNSIKIDANNDNEQPKSHWLDNSENDSKAKSNQTEDGKNAISYFINQKHLNNDNDNNEENLKNHESYSGNSHVTQFVNRKHNDANSFSGKADTSGNKHNEKAGQTSFSQTTAVPEPETWTMLIVGLITLSFGKNRFKHTLLA